MPLLISQLQHHLSKSLPYCTYTRSLTSYFSNIDDKGTYKYVLYLCTYTYYLIANQVQALETGI